MFAWQRPCTIAGRSDSRVSLRTVTGGGTGVTKGSVTADNSGRLTVGSRAGQFRSSEEIQAARARAEARAEPADVWLGLVEPRGSAAGPCTQVCAHRYCILERATADSQCTRCRRPIGYGRQYIADSESLRHDACETTSVRLRRQLPTREPAIPRRRDEEPDAFDKVVSEDDTIYELADFRARARRGA